MDERIKFGNGKQVLERIEKDRLSGASKKSYENYVVLVENPNNKFEVGVNNADDVVKSFEEKGALKGETETVVRLVESSVAKANGKLPPIFVNKNGREIVDIKALIAHIEQPFESEE